MIIYDNDWQFPAITEKYAFQKIKEFGIFDSNVDCEYVAFPWATIIDLLNTGKPKGKELKSILSRLKCEIQPGKIVVTVCQHILMLKFQSLFEELGITDVFWAHAVKGQTNFPNYPNIRIHSFPLYPVQAAVAENFSSLNRDILYSFVGARANKWYLTESRNMILDLLSSDKDGFVIGRDQWHYNKIVYDLQISETGSTKDEKLIDNDASEQFKAILSRSIFSLCPSGSGPNSIRLWESIGLGSIPVILADTYLPPGNEDLWHEAVVYCGENVEDIIRLPNQLSLIAKDTELLARKRHAMKQLWMLYGPDCFVYDIMKFLLSKNELQASSRGLFFQFDIQKLIKCKVPDRLLVSAISTRLLVAPEVVKNELENSEYLTHVISRLINDNAVTGVSLLKKICKLKGVLL